MRFKPGTTNAEAKAKAAAFAEKQRIRNARPVDRGPGSGGAPGFNPRTGNYVPPRPGMAPPPPGQINPGKPNVMGFPDKQERDQGPRGEFFNSPEFAGVTNYRGPATRDMYSSKYFGQLGSGTMGKKQDAAYEAYLNRTGQRPGYGLKPEGIPNTRLPSPFRRPVAQPDVMGFPDEQPTQQSMQRGAGGARLPIGVGPSMPVTQQLLQGLGIKSPQQVFEKPTPLPLPPRPSGMPMGIAQMGLGGVPANRPPLSPAAEAFAQSARSGMSSVNTTTTADIMGRPRPNSGGFNPANMQQGLQSLAAQNNPQAVAKPAFKKGGKVSAKAPVKKAAGGKVAAKAPVKKAMGGKVAAKPMGKPVMKKAGGRVAAKPMMKGCK